MMLGTPILLIRNNHDKAHEFLFTIVCYHHTHLNILCFENNDFSKKGKLNLLYIISNQ